MGDVDAYAIASGESDSVEYDRIRCVRETDLAILVEGIDPEARWIPKKAIHDHSEVWREGDFGKLVIHAWLVRMGRQWSKGGWDEDGEAPPTWWSAEIPRGREVPTPAVLRNRPLKPPGR